MKTLNQWLGMACFVVSALGVQAAGVAEDGRIAVRVVDGDGNLTPVRAWVDAAGHRLFRPLVPKSATPYAKDRSFSCEGAFTMVAPSGNAVVHVEKGKEFLPRDIEVSVAAGETMEKTIQMTRWIDMQWELKPHRSGWIASRALYRAPDGLLRQAHTSPIYLSVDGKPAASAADARYMLQWIDRLARIAKSHPDRFPDADAQSTVLETYGEARTLHHEIVAQAQRLWDD